MKKIVQWKIWTWLVACSKVDCPKRQQDTTYNIQQKHDIPMSRHYWDIYTTYDIEFLRRKNEKKNCEKKFFSEF